MSTKYAELIYRLRGPSPSIPAMRDAAAALERLEKINSELVDKSNACVIENARLAALAAQPAQAQPLTEREVENVLWLANWPEVLLSDFVRAKLRELIRNTERAVGGRG